MAERLTTKQRWVLRMLADRTWPDDPEAEPAAGWVATGETFDDIEADEVAIHWRTARALHARGLVWFPVGSGYERDLTTVALTKAGWAALGREVPAGVEAGDD